jgi:hypothetical protein
MTTFRAVACVGIILLGVALFDPGDNRGRTLVAFGVVLATIAFGVDAWLEERFGGRG